MYFLSPFFFLSTNVCCIVVVCSGENVIRPKSVSQVSWFAVLFVYFMMPLSIFFFKLQIRFKFYLLTAEKHNASRIDFLCILVRFSEEKKKICNKAALLMRSTCQNKPGQYLIWFGCYYIHRYYWTLFLSRSLLFYVYVCVSVCFFSFLWFYFVCVRFSFFSRLFVCLLSVSVYSFLSNRTLHSEHKFHFRFWLKCSVYVLFICLFCNQEKEKKIGWI